MRIPATGGSCSIIFHRDYVAVWEHTYCGWVLVLRIPDEDGDPVTEQKARGCDRCGRPRSDEPGWAFYDFEIYCPACAAACDWTGENCGEGHDPTRICCAHAADVKRLRARVAELEPIVQAATALVERWRAGTAPPGGIGRLEDALVAAVGPASSQPRLKPTPEMERPGD